FGSILSVGQADIYMILILTAISALLFTGYYRPILYTAFHPEFSKINGLKANSYRYLMAALVSLAIVVSIRTMGIILLLSHLTIPLATSMIFTHDFRKVIGLSAVFGIIGAFAVLYVAHAMDIPSGAPITFT